MPAVSRVLPSPRTHPEIMTFRASFFFVTPRLPLRFQRDARLC